MEEIDKRLRDATDAVLAAHAAWDGNKKNGPARENLQEKVHELRKVTARFEIEIAVSERDEMAAKPLPIPPHRSNRKRPGEMNDFGHDDEGQGNNGGNMQPQDNQSGGGGGHDAGIARTMGRRRRPSGGGQGGPFGNSSPQGERAPAPTPGSGPQPTTGTLSPTGGNGGRTE